jgi:hypothetical protein
MSMFGSHVRYVLFTMFRHIIHTFIKRLEIKRRIVFRILPQCMHVTLTTVACILPRLQTKAAQFTWVFCGRSTVEKQGSYILYFLVHKTLFSWRIAYEIFLHLMVKRFTGQHKIQMDHKELKQMRN